MPWEKEAWWGQGTEMGLLAGRTGFFLPKEAGGPAGPSRPFPSVPLLFVTPAHPQGESLGVGPYSIGQ